MLQQVQTRQADALSCWQELTCHGPLEPELEDAEQDGQAAAPEQGEPAVLVRQAGGALNLSPVPQPGSSQPEPQVVVAALHPAISWEAITANWHPSASPSPDTLQPIRRLSAQCPLRGLRCVSRCKALGRRRGGFPVRPGFGAICWTVRVGGFSWRPRCGAG